MDWQVAAEIIASVVALIALFGSVLLWVGRISARVMVTERVVDSDRGLFTKLADTECAHGERLARLEKAVEILESK